MEAQGNDGVHAAMGWVCAECNKKFLIGWSGNSYDKASHFCPNCLMAVAKDGEHYKFIVW